MNRRLAVRAVIFNDDKLFCVKLKAYGGKDARAYWCLPGGGMDDSESLLNALEREMIEETGIKPTVGNLLYIQQFSFEDQKQFEFFFHVTNSQDYIHLDLSTASQAEEEIDTLDFVDPKTTYILPEFLTTENIAEQIEESLPTKVFNYL